MSYAMTHWIIANEIAKSKKIYNKGLFLLGAIAPDGVHERANYEKWMKQKSHFMPEGFEWGLTTSVDDVTSWYYYLGKTYNEKESLTNDKNAISFLQGVTIHILTDILNTRTLYVPALENFGIEVLELGSEYRVQCVNVDLQLYSLYKESNEMIQLMEDALVFLSKSNILDKLELKEFPNVNEIGSFMHGVRYMYENDKPKEIAQDYNSVSMSKEFIELSIEKCRNMLFDFPNPGNVFE